MTKEQKKAEELYEFFSDMQIQYCTESGFDNMFMDHGSALKCAIKVCDEVIDRMEDVHKPEYLTFATWGEEGADTRNGYEELEFWQSVKQHLEQM